MSGAGFRVIEAPRIPDEEWNAFCLAHGWFWHTTWWRDYTLAYGTERGAEEAGFAIEGSSGLAAVVPLVREAAEVAGEDVTAFAYGGGPVWAPAVADLLPSARQAALRLALEEIDRRAAAVDVGYVSLQLSPLVPRFEEAAVDFLAGTSREGWVDASLTTQVLDLGLTPEKLAATMAGRHRRSIEQARELAVTVSADPAEFAVYQELHRQASGRETRSLDTFTMMRKWLVDETGLLAIARLDDVPVGAAYVMRFGTGAYYASAANLPDVGLPVGHALLWELALALRVRGVRRFEIGIQHYGRLPYDEADAKQINIALFKRGFGGRAEPLIRRELYRSAALFERVTQHRMEHHAGNLQP